MSEESVTRYLAQNPRMIGAMFTILLLLSQVGSAVAGGGGSSIAGP